MKYSRETSACITMDIEFDWIPGHCDIFDDDAKFILLCDLLEKFDIRMTGFVVGRILEKYPDQIKELARRGVEFGSHSYSHDLDPTKQDYQVRAGIAIFTKFFGHPPQGYRSPYGRLSHTILGALESEGVQYDSSIIPSYRPGSYSNLKMPMTPFRWGNMKLVELPISVLPYARIPFALSYAKVFGKTTFKMALKWLGAPKNLVMLSHPADLTHSGEARASLPPIWKFLYSLNHNQSWTIFQDLIEYVKREGYEFAYMSEFYTSIAQGNLQTVNTEMLTYQTTMPSHLREKT